MTDDLLLDTHIALWLENGEGRLCPSTLSLIDRCWRNGGTVLLSAVVTWEIAQLIDVGRITLVRPLAEWVERFLDHPGMEAVPLSHQAAMGAYQLHPLAHRDPADRMPIATAIERGCPLVTHDERITRFAAMHGARHGFTVQM